MKNKIPLFNEEFESITGGFEFYSNNKLRPVLLVNKDELDFISNNYSEILADFHAIKKSFRNRCNSDFFVLIAKQYLEAGGFKNTYKGEV